MLHPPIDHHRLLLRHSSLQSSNTSARSRSLLSHITLERQSIEQVVRWLQFSPKQQEETCGRQQVVQVLQPASGVHPHCSITQV